MKGRFPSHQTLVEPYMIFQMRNIFIEQYKVAAAEGAVVELKLRLLADKIPALQQYAHAQKLEDIENEVALYFGSMLSEDDKKTLGLCRQLRNKILHCNFSVARSTLQDLGKEPQRGDVIKVDLSGLTGAPMRATLKDVVAGTGTFEYVADKETKTPGSIFGWLLEIANSGDLLKALDAFKSASAILDRLAVTYTDDGR